MKNAIISSILFISFIKGQIPDYKKITNDSNFKIFNIDVNKDGISDKVVSEINGNGLYFYEYKNNEYINIYQGINYSMDGVYVVDMIKEYNEDENVIYIKCIFNGSGGQTVEYFLSYLNKNWTLAESFTTSNIYSKTKVCKNIQNFNNDKMCIIINDENILTGITKNIQSKKNISFYSKAYFFSLLNSVLLTAKTVSQYNNLAFYLSQNDSKKSSAIFLYKQILEKFPQRTVAYVNLADAYWDSGNKQDARKNYKQYISLMKSQNKDLKKIPKRVYERIK